MTKPLLKSPQKVIFWFVNLKCRSFGVETFSAFFISCDLRFSAPRLVRLTTKLNNVAAMEGKEAIFKCAVNPADASVKWFHNSLPVTAGSKYKIAQGGGSHSLTITSVTQKDAGEISVDAEGKSCQATLQVQRKNLNSSLNCVSSSCCKM